MITLFFDTETNGLPKSWKAPVTEIDNWPRIIQLAWAVYEGSELMESRVDMICPDGWEIPKEPFWLDHGYSTEASLESGIPIADALWCLVEAIEIADVMVAHNMSFDKSIVAVEMIRLGMTTANKPKKICTMVSGTKYCELPGQYGLKWPKLEELHDKLFGTEAGQQHDAMSDVLITAKCYFEMLKRGIIEL